MSKVLDAYLEREEQKAEDMYANTHPPKRSSRQLTYGQNAYLKRQPRDFADHIRQLLNEDKNYGLEYQQESHKFVLTVTKNYSTKA